jgi:hypothetical protein
MPLFNDATWFLLGIALILIVLNFVVHRLRRKTDKPVHVAFIPPRSNEENTSPETSSRFDAHISSTNQKLSQLHERLVAVENTLLRLQDFFSETKNADSFSPSAMEQKNSPILVRARSSRARKK